MIIGVATGKDFRGEVLLRQLYPSCVKILAEEGHHVCYNDNPEAGRIYNRLGFREIVNWKHSRFKNELTFRNQGLRDLWPIGTKLSSPEVSGNCWYSPRLIAKSCFEMIMETPFDLKEAFPLWQPNQASENIFRHNLFKQLILSSSLRIKAQITICNFL